MAFDDVFEPLGAGAGLPNVAVLTSPTYGQASSFGNVGSFPFAGTGVPADIYAPVSVFQKYGLSNPGGNITKTTQALFATASYYGPTTNDSAEGASGQAILADNGAGAFTQALPVVGLEGDGIVQGSNICTSKVIGVTAAAEGQTAAQITNAMAFYVAAKGARDAGVAITNWYGLYQETPAVVGVVTNKWGAYFHDDVQAEKRLVVGVAGVLANNARVYIQGPNVSGGETDVPTLISQAGAGQTTAQLQLRTSGNAVRLQAFGASGNIQLGNGATGGSGVGLLSMVTTTIPSGTPPAAGAYLFVDPADNKLKAKTSGGTTTILTPTA